MKRLYRKEFTRSRTRNEADRHAEEIIKEAMYGIKRKYSALVDAVNMLKPTPVCEEIKGVSTDGTRLFYNSGYISRECKAADLTNQILHIVFHGLLGHFDKGDAYEHRELAWDVMDLQVLNMFNELGIDPLIDKDCLIPAFMSVPRDVLTDVKDLLQGQVSFSMYYQAEDDRNLQKRIKSISNSVKRKDGLYLDDHTTWALPLLELKVEQKNAGGQGGPGDEWKQITMLIVGGPGSGQGLSDRELENALIRAIKKSGMKTWGSSMGGYMGEEIEAEKESQRTYYDLLEEASIISESSNEEDCLDPALYEYGLSMYGDVPIVEPLEYSEKKELGSVVIAIDTSGSCNPYMKDFWTETVEIFGEIGRTTDIKALHYLECDAGIQYEKEIKSVSELQEMAGESHSFTGFGGTSFCPVFDKVEEYAKSGEKIDFLVYFSDGEGDFPAWEPDYPVYFVIPDTDWECYGGVNIPKWVKKLKLEEKNS